MILPIEENTKDHRNRLACKATGQRSVSCTLQLFGGMEAYDLQEFQVTIRRSHL